MRFSQSSTAPCRYYYLRIISYMYLKELAGPEIAEPKGYAVVLILILIGIIGIGVFPQPFYDWVVEVFLL